MSAQETISAAEFRKICHAYTKEKEWQKSVEGVLRMSGWLVYHTLGSMGSTAGFPDIVALKVDPKSGVCRMIVAELKTEKGRLSGAQKDWMDKFARMPGAEVFVWRPSQFDEVLEVASR